MYVAPTFSVLLAARWNGSAPTAPSTTVQFASGLMANHRGAFDGVEHAVEINAYTLEGTPSTRLVKRSAQGAARKMTHRQGAASAAERHIDPQVLTASVELVVGGGFSAVLLPKPSCDALLLVTPATIPTIDILGRNSTTVLLELHAPWQPAATRASTMAGRPITVHVTAPGLVLSASTITFSAGGNPTQNNTLTLAVHQGAAAAAGKKPAFFMLTVEGDGVFPTRRWVRAA
jgi:hypothetical protein